ncbi:molybdopterin-binding protein [Marinovum sp. 2_MG-2023]|uniref:molybdopterin-binding protein n=1 Tax=unclassified Marinovum TaxID=2647166 RepID=UPI0026E321E4|nr:MULTISPECIES: molybdopterin-binding protein [unclassified Marinovum]MDO6729352.1 molybdopterin-binding protein [Marinovum sp. 2_MG-2023]MDO6780432.1 molybdopterin-binding protein [Marinovum sp. 1_MG-2023]
MRFGPLPVADALGAVLAHSLQLNGRKLRKGVTLTAQHIADLTAAGEHEVIVARLDAGDIHENEAAAQLAGALVPDPAAAGLRLTKAFTGRVNLIAEGPGVAMLDVDRLVALNRINPMITLATVPNFQQMSPGGMVGTVKIIAYAVPENDLRAAMDRARSAIRLARPVVQTASLIVSEIPGGAGEKGVPAIAARLAALNVTLEQVVPVPHKTQTIAEALRRVNSDLVLILTGSATSDPADVAPEALRQAGGRVIRFGMPVDPGNLLFLGDMAGRPVIGLPGCARSPALNGADWVLSRVACGIAIDHDDIAAMGVGGLLKEIPTRPQPRGG